jgi:hypothetical protein
MVFRKAGMRAVKTTPTITKIQTGAKPLADTNAGWDLWRYSRTAIATDTASVSKKVTRAWFAAGAEEIVMKATGDTTPEATFTATTTAVMSPIGLDIKTESVKLATTKSAISLSILGLAVNTMIVIMVIDVNLVIKTATRRNTRMDIRPATSPLSTGIRL